MSTPSTINTAADNNNINNDGSLNNKRKATDALEADSDNEYFDTTDGIDDSHADAHPAKRSKKEERLESIRKAKAWLAEQERKKQAKVAAVAAPVKPADKTAPMAVTIAPAKTLCEAASKNTSPSSQVSGSSMKASSAVEEKTKPAASVPAAAANLRETSTPPHRFQAHGSSSRVSMSPSLTIKTTTYLNATATTSTATPSPAAARDDIATPPRFHENSFGGYIASPPPRFLPTDRLQAATGAAHGSSLDGFAMHRAEATMQDDCSGSDYGYETGDSDEEVFAARRILKHEKRQVENAVLGYQTDDSEDDEDYDGEASMNSESEQDDGSVLESDDESIQDDFSESSDVTEISDDDVFAAHPAWKQDGSQDGPKITWWWTLLAGILSILKTAIVSLAIMSLIFVTIGLVTVVMTDIAGDVMSATAVAPPPCFTSNTPGNGSVPWSQRCVAAAAAHQLYPCPQGGVCIGGKLMSCRRFDSYGRTALAFAPNSDRASCGLARETASTLDAIMDRLMNLSVADYCREPSSIAARNSGHSMTGSSANEPYRPMFNFGDLIDELELATVEGDKKDLSFTLHWLEIALKSRIVSGFNLEWTGSEVWIGLSDDVLDGMSLESKCIAAKMPALLTALG